MKTPFLRQARRLFVIAVLPFVAAAASESPSLLLQKGIYAEEIEQNLDSAIKIYTQISAEAAASRSVVAQAQYRLAVCYQKKGEKEQAIKVLNELVQQFPSDAALTQKARAMFTELGVTAPEAVSVRKIPLPISTTSIMSISQDGRFVAYWPITASEPRGNNAIAVCEVPTGKTWTVAKGTKENSVWYDAQISPDGQWIAYQLNRETSATIYVSKIDGSENRLLLESDEKKEGVMLAEWSPDSKHVIVWSWHAGVPPPGRPSGNLIFALDAKTGAKKEVARESRVERKTVGFTEVSDPGFAWSKNLSADRRYLASRHGTYPQTITLWDLKSGREETVVDRDAGKVFGWFPGNTKLLYSKNRIGSTDLWAVGIKDGQPSGEPEMIWNNLGDVSPLCIAPDGTIYGYYRGTAVLCVMQGLLKRNPSVAKTESRRIQTDIPPDEMILGSENSILDRKFGFGATLPKGWTISSAVRQGNGGTVIQFTSSEIRDARSTPRIIYWPTTPWENPGSAANNFGKVGPKPTTSAEIEAWLHKRIGGRAPGYDNFKITRPAASTVINGRHAVTKAASYTQGGKPWAQLITVVYSEKVIVGCDLKAPAEKIEQMRPAFERLLGTIQLP